ncbi:MAG: cob(I)yrinic acid a,c-diamide adenosyltransferase [bacterium]|nr:cob(I)yrinic acid a,c-diamide adenosyltransferase [bacterium]
MPIYTKKGDTGTTSLFADTKETRRLKDNPRIVAIGTVDELNSNLGLVLAFLSTKASRVKKLILSLQEDLHKLAAELASPKGKPPFKIGSERVSELEREIDKMQLKLKPLKNFILPGGSKAGALMHQTRTICRRTERELVTFTKKEKVNPELLTYINRLSDLLFVLARTINKLEGKRETVWKGRG